MRKSQSSSVVPRRSNRFTSSPILNSNVKTPMKNAMSSSNSVSSNTSSRTSLSRMLSNRRSELSLALVDGDWTRASHLLREKPARAAKWTVQQGFFDGVKDASVLPLHQAVMLQAPWHLVQQLLASYPEAVHQAESSYQRLPLHCACRTGAVANVVRSLIQAGGPDTCLHPDTLLRTPLHYALSNGASLETVQALLEAAPSSAHVIDSRGWTPLHVAASAGCALAVLQQVYEAFPSAVVHRTKRGSLPRQCVPTTVPHRVELKQFLKQAAENHSSSTAAPVTTPQQPADTGKRPVGRLPLNRAVSCPITSPAGPPSVSSHKRPTLMKQHSTYHEPTMFVPLMVHRSVLV